MLLLFSLPLVAGAQQPGSTASLTVTDKQAVEKWSRSTYGQQPDPKNDVAGDTQFLLSLTDTERQGAYLFRQHCNACHGPQMMTFKSYGPRLSKENVIDREDLVRSRIMEGSPNMPAFRYALQPAQVSNIIAYLKKVEKVCKDCKLGDYRR
jgi:cytochrome c2